METEKIQEEFSDYIQEGFKPLITEDGSYTLIQKSLEEEMHSRRGALSESIYVYGEALNLFLNKTKYKKSRNEHVVVSVGLGLGYNEIISAHYAIRNKIENKFKIISYEKEDKLIKLFKKRLEFPERYKLYWGSLEEILNVKVSEVIETLSKKIDFKRVLNKDSLGQIKNAEKCILFDAYSKKTSPELWDFDFLNAFFGFCLEGSVVATYASTGVLKRSLESNGFINLQKKGFMGKRESTLAHKFKCD